MVRVVSKPKREEYWPIYANVGVLIPELGLQALFQHLISWLDECQGSPVAQEKRVDEPSPHLVAVTQISVIQSG